MGMCLYEINKEIEKLIDPETGEITDIDAFESLQITRDEKLEALAIVYKNKTAEAKAIKEEIDALKARMTSLTNQAENIASRLQDELNGAEFRTSKVKVSYRKSTSVDISDDEAFIEWAKANGADYLTFADPKVSKTAIKEALEKNIDVPYCVIGEHMNMQIK